MLAAVPHKSSGQIVERLPRQKNMVHTDIQHLAIAVIQGFFLIYCNNKVVLPTPRTPRIPTNRACQAISSAKLRIKSVETCCNNLNCRSNNLLSKVSFILFVYYWQTNLQKKCLLLIIKVDFLYSATTNKNLPKSGFLIKLINRLLLRVKFLMPDNRCFFSENGMF